MKWREEEGKWISNFRNVKLVVSKGPNNVWEGKVFSFSILFGEMLFLNGVTGGSPGAVMTETENVVMGFVSGLRRVYDKAQEGSILRDDTNPHMVWTRTLLGIEGEGKMLTNEDVEKGVFFVKCPACGGKHLLGSGKEVPVYWCGRVLKKLKGEDKVDAKYSGG